MNFEAMMNALLNTVPATSTSASSDKAPKGIALYDGVIDYTNSKGVTKKVLQASVELKDVKEFADGVDTGNTHKAVDIWVYPATDKSDGKYPPCEALKKALDVQLKLLPNLAVEIAGLDSVEAVKEAKVVLGNDKITLIDFIKGLSKRGCKCSLDKATNKYRLTMIKIRLEEKDGKISMRVLKAFPFKKG